MDKLKAYFFGDTPVYEYTNRMVHEEDLKSSTARYQAMQDGTYKFNKDDDKKDLMTSERLHINAVKKLIKKEPDTGLVPLDLNLPTNKNYQIDGITSAGDKIYINTHGISISKYDPHLERDVNGELVGPLTPATITKEQALSKAQELLKELGLNDFKYYDDGNLIDRANMRLSQSGNTGNPYEYSFEFTRVVGGVQLAGRFSKPEFGEKVTDAEVKFDNNFFQETIRISVNDSGICYFRWVAPFSKEPANGNTQLMDVDKIKQIAKDQLLKKYTDYEAQTNSDGGKDSEYYRLDNYTLSVKSMKLEYARVPVNGDYDTPYLVPVWNVYATNTESGWYKENGKEVYHKSNKSDTTIELTINAIDGSVIGTQSEYNY